jgi:hypothetical protein
MTASLVGIQTFALNHCYDGVDTTPSMDRLTRVVRKQLDSPARASNKDPFFPSYRATDVARRSPPSSPGLIVVAIACPRTIPFTSSEYDCIAWPLETV